MFIYFVVVDLFSGAKMAAVAFTGGYNVAKNNVGSIGVLYVQSSKYSSQPQKINVAAWKRGTGGRSSFNGVVATVFGCTGFVGQILCNRLGKIGTQLILPHRCDFYDARPLKLTGDLGQVLFQEFDIRDKKSVAQAIKYSNVVINLIGRDYETKNFKYEDIHIEWPKQLGRMCREMGIPRLIHMSYLNSAEHPPQLAVKGGSAYKRTKWWGEQVVREEFPDVTIVKAADVYGERDRFTNYFGYWWRTWQELLPLYKNGAGIFKQPVAVGDVCQGIVNIAQNPDTIGKVYQAVGPKRYEMCELVDYLFRVMRKEGYFEYKRYDSRYDPFFALKVWVSENLSPGPPYGKLHWEAVDKEGTTDVVRDDLPTLEDLGVVLTELETEMPYLLKYYRAFNFYNDEFNEFKRAGPPKTVPLGTM